MRCLERNKTDFEYFPYDSIGSDLNDDGEHTGEFKPGYGDPIPYRGNISTPSGHTVHTFYGEDIKYTHTLVMDDPNAEIDVYGRIHWKGNMYEITAVRPSINSLSIALKRITEDHGEPYVPDNSGQEPDGDEP